MLKIANDVSFHLLGTDGYDAQSAIPHMLEPRSIKKYLFVSNNKVSLSLTNFQILNRATTPLAVIASKDNEFKKKSYQLKLHRTFVGD